MSQFPISPTHSYSFASHTHTHTHTKKNLKLNCFWMLENPQAQTTWKLTFLSVLLFHSFTFPAKKKKRERHLSTWANIYLSMKSKWQRKKDVTIIFIFKFASHFIYSLSLVLRLRSILCVAYSHLFAFFFFIKHQKPIEYILCTAVWIFG